MTDTQSTSNTPVSERWDGHSVIAVSFAYDDTAYSALTLLKELDSHWVGVEEAVVVVRDEDGQIIQKDRVESESRPGTASGGIMGLLLGILGGPFGVLIGGATGPMVGSTFDLADFEETDSALGSISSSVKVGRTALLAVVTEQSPEVVNVAMSTLGGTVSRRSVADVEAEIAAAEEAERKAKREARKELIRVRHERNKAGVSAKVDELRTRLQRAPKAHTR
jgi:uncharacterized membrane protein